MFRVFCGILHINHVNCGAKNRFLKPFSFFSMRRDCIENYEFQFSKPPLRSHSDGMAAREPEAVPRDWKKTSQPRLNVESAPDNDGGVVYRLTLSYTRRKPMFAAQFSNFGLNFLHVISQRVCPGHPFETKKKNSHRKKTVSLPEFASGGNARF